MTIDLDVTVWSCAALIGLVTIALAAFGIVPDPTGIVAGCAFTMALVKGRPK